MRHQRDGRQFGRNSSHRAAMFRNIANAVILQEQIQTTLQKAKETRRVVDRLITLAKRGTQTPSSRRLAFDRTRDEQVVKKLFTVLADRYKSRDGGYTRVLRMSETRRGDAAEMAVLELVDHKALNRKKKPKAAPAAGSEPEKLAGESKAADPMGRFRKMFGGKKKDKSSPGGQAPGAPRAETKHKPRARSSGSS